MIPHLLLLRVLWRLFVSPLVAALRTFYRTPRGRRLLGPYVRAHDTAFFAFPTGPLITGGGALVALGGMRQPWFSFVGPNPRTLNGWSGVGVLCGAALIALVLLVVCAIVVGMSRVRARVRVACGLAFSLGAIVGFASVLGDAMLLATPPTLGPGFATTLIGCTIALIGGLQTLVAVSEPAPTRDAPARGRLPRRTQE